MARPGPPGGPYQPLAEDQIKQIHQASLTVLERTGIHVENEQALALYRQGRAWAHGHRVYIPPVTVKEALEKVPSKVLPLGWKGCCGSTKPLGCLPKYTRPSGLDSTSCSRHPPVVMLHWRSRNLLHARGCVKTV